MCTLACFVLLIFCAYECVCVCARVHTILCSVRIPSNLRLLPGSLPLLLALNRTMELEKFLSGVSFPIVVQPCLGLVWLLWRAVVGGGSATIP